MKMCSKNSAHSRDRTADVCLLKDLTSGVWVNEALLIVYETNRTMREITWSCISQSRYIVKIFRVGA